VLVLRMYYCVFLSFLLRAQGARPSELAPDETEHSFRPKVLRAQGSRPSELAQYDKIEHSFLELYRKYWKHYEQGLPRTLPELAKHEIPLQFEFEIDRHQYDLKMTPEILLMRSGITPPEPPKDGIFETASPWFHVEVDGIGKRHYQSLGAVPEIDSVVMRPENVLNSNFTDDFEDFLRMKTNRAKKKYKFQFTIGIPLEQISEVMSWSREEWLEILQGKVEDYCQPSSKPCTSNYKNALLLAAMVIEKARNCRSCCFPKRCQDPWLVRSNFGDVATGLLSREEQSDLAGDVLKLLNLSGEEHLYPHGILDYLHFPEMAEMAGLVHSRSEDDPEAPPRGSAGNMPTEPPGLLRLSEEMLKQRAKVNERLRARKCKLHAKTQRDVQGPTVRDWLDGIASGIDLMSDHSSPLSQDSFSRTLWRSMGQWRFQNDGDRRIHLECREPYKCLGKVLQTWRNLSYKAMFFAVAEKVRSLEIASRNE